MSEELLTINRRRVGTVSEKTMEKYKKIFCMYNAGYTYKQISNELGITESVVSSGLYYYRNRHIDDESMLEFCKAINCPERVCGILYRLGYESVKDVYNLFENNTAKLIDIPNMGDCSIVYICESLIDLGYDVDTDEILYIKNKFKKHSSRRAMSNAYFETLKNFPSVVNKVRTEKDLIRSIHMNPKCIDYLKPKLISKKVRKEILKIQGVL